MNEELNFEEIKRELTDFIGCLEGEVLECIRRGDKTREKLFKEKIEEINKMIETIHLGGRTEETITKAINLVKESRKYRDRVKKQKIKSIIILVILVAIFVFMYFYNK